MDSTAYIEWDGRRRPCTTVMDFAGHRTGDVLEAAGWEPRYYFAGKTVFHLSKLDGLFYPATHYERAPGWRKS